MSVRNGAASVAMDGRHGPSVGANSEEKRRGSGFAKKISS